MAKLAVETKLAKLAVEIKLLRLAVETKLTKLAVETKLARFAVEIKLVRLAVETKPYPPRFVIAADKYPTVPKPITVLVRFACVTKFTPTIRLVDIIGAYTIPVFT